MTWQTALRQHWPEYAMEAAELSGMSINPARSFGPAALDASVHLWIYFLAPTFGMLLAAASYCSLRGTAAVDCAKLHHQNRRRCIFCGAGSGGETRPRMRHPKGVAAFSCMTRLLRAILWLSATGARDCRIRRWASGGRIPCATPMDTECN